ncbi:TolC family protein [Enterobacter bugandensis]|uniref:TolC family protein n=1 Tax=Enterobacter bugandensis TaxID=881260 RepID=UPI0021D030B1|nr:TolC family protein [Enterobacter bugandensis]MCU6172078.1 TolC family protein [Enterobacter bugandensis]MCU6190441.1 TolC family protein [Enterobacter bugandensis]
MKSIKFKTKLYMYSFLTLASFLSITQANADLLVIRDSRESANMHDVNSTSPAFNYFANETKDANQGIFHGSSSEERAVAREHFSSEETAYKTMHPANKKNDDSSDAALTHNLLKIILNDLFKEGVQNSPQVNSARFLHDAATESVKEAKGQRLPQVDINSNSKSVYFGGGNKDKRDYNNADVQVTMAVNVLDFGQTTHLVKSREEQAVAAKYNVTAQQENLAWLLVSAYTEMYKQKLIIEVSKDYVDRMQELTEMLEGIVKIDTGRRGELTQARGKLLQAQSSLEAAITKAKDQEIILQRHTGKADWDVPLRWRWDLQPGDLNELLSRIHTNPAIIQAKAEIQSALSEAKALDATKMPKVNWVVSKNLGDDVNGNRQAFETGIQLSWGIFRGGSTTAAVKAATMKAESARQNMGDQLNELEQRIRAGDHDAKSLLDRAALYRSLSSESDKIRNDFFQQWYHLGKRTLLDVLSAEGDFYNHRTGEITSRFDAYISIMKGYASAGILTSWLENRS